MIVVVTCKEVKKNLLERGARGRWFVNEKEGVATTLLYNLSGKIVGYQQYRPSADKGKKNNPRDSRYFTYISKGELGVWGLQSIKPDTTTLFITEGVFDACKLHAQGVAAVAVLCNSLKPLNNWLFSLPYRLVIVGDAERSFPGSIPPPEGRKDLGEATYEEVRHWLNNLGEIR